MNQKKKTLLLLLIVFSAALLRGNALQNRALGVDEGFTIPFIQESYGKIMETFQVQETHPPLYPLFARTVFLLGGSIYWVRVSSALLGIGTVIVCYLLSRELFNERTALLAGALIAFNPLCVFYYQQIRSYSLLIFLFSLLAFTLFKYSKQPKKVKLALAIGILNALILYTHYHAAIIMLSEALLLGFWWRKKRISLKQGLFPLVIGGILFLPWVPTLVKHLGMVNAGSFGGRPVDLFYIFYKYAVGANLSFLLQRAPVLLVLFPLVSGLALTGVVFALREKEYFFPLLLVLPVALSIAFVPVVPKMLHFRHLSYTIPFYSMALAYGLSRIRDKRIAFTLLAVTLALWTGIIVLYYSIVSIPNWNALIGL